MAAITRAVREPRHLLPRQTLLHPAHLRPRLLRLADRLEVVEPVHSTPLAGQHGHPGRHLPHGQGGEAETDEEEHHPIHPPLLLHGHESRQLQRLDLVASPRLDVVDVQ